MENIFKIDSVESIIKYIKNVESSNSEKIKDMIINDVDMFFEINKILTDLKNYSDRSIDENIVDVKILILKLHQKLLMLDQQNTKHLKEIDEIFGDSKIVYHLLKENKELLL